ncbi:unnamed protein product [Closterium sp. Yama58-4]|nr:unnamed protein product [Closterium sp. Yama58-4]
MAVTKEPDATAGDTGRDQSRRNGEADQAAATGGERAAAPETRPEQPEWPEGQPDWVIGEGMSAEDAEKLKEVLAKPRAAFAYTLKEVGRCNMAVVTLELTTDIPVYQRRRRMTAEETQICKEKCQELLEAGFIRRSNSEYAAATVVAARTDLTGKVLSKRMCGDNKGLNKVTVMKRYQTPMPDELFDLLAEALVFTTLDLRQGFNQIPLAEADKKKTAFHGPDGQYEWNFLPFGLKSASPEFQRVMDQVLRDVKNAACYIDDVIVFSTDSSTHVADVEATLSAIQGAGLTCHPGKCSFGQTMVAYLGFEVEGGKIGIQKAKVEVLDRVATPKDRSSLRALLDFLNYYRKFVPNFSSRATTLNQLLREDQPWEWDPDQERAVQDLMGAVKNGAVLELPRADLPFTLYTDWSSAGMGAVLAQMKGEEEKVVAFASRSCNAAEANYSSYEGEGLAVVWAVKHFRVYLQGRKFTLVTDHQPLLWLMQTPDLTGRNARWAMKLQEYDFEIRHRPGKTMQHVDGLSRNPPAVQPSACLMAMAKEADKGQVWGEQKGGPADIWEDHAALAWIQGATTEEGAVPARVRARGDHYRWFKEQVQLRTGEGWKHVPPPAEREGIISEVHAKLGHYGPLRTQQLVQTGWWWAGMRQQIKDWVGKCEACCRNRAVLEREKAELQPLPIVSLGYRWSLDIAGELPVTTKGRRYILLMVEHVSKWAEARPLVHKSAEGVAEAFEEMVITRLGACGEVLTDQGTEFAGAFDQLLQASGIRHRTTSRYHPQSDGLTERLVQTVKKGLRAYGEEHKRDWDRKLCLVMAGYRFSKQAALKDVSPYYLLFGKEPVLPVGAPKLLVDVITTGSPEKWVAVADARAAYLRHLLSAALENLHVAQLRDIERYKRRQEANGKGAAVGVQEEDEVYIRRQRKHALDVGLSQQRWTVKEVRPRG